ncbi:type I restriction-modification system subunit M [Kordiimonas sp.]|uniref:type I restriction-modification system subunit M n=1 Tax=Kordiimonas sp. TaxID=1970157 RepID=UPI003A9593D4
MNSHQSQVAFIWSIAELLRGDYRQSEYGRVVLPFTVLRRLDCVLEATKGAVLAKAATITDNLEDEIRNRMLSLASGYNFYNTSSYTFAKLTSDPDHLAKNLRHLVNGFPDSIRQVFSERFKFFDQIDRLEEANLLFLVVERFAEVDLHENVVDNHGMGAMFEELIRRFSEQSNETAGEHFTPREVIKLMVNLLFTEDREEALSKPGVIRTLYDPACGTGGMLSVAQDYLETMNSTATLKVFGQELNGESFAICQSDMMIKGQEANNIKFGNSFTQDGLPGQTFDYVISNPPFGVEWKKIEKEIRAEADGLGLQGRFGAGLPRVSDGSLLFLQHMISKFHKDGKPSRLAVVLNGSPLFTGGAGSGESEIRRWIIENDWLEAIIALPDQLFYNTGISTYIWVVTNQKLPSRKGKVQLINAVDMFEKMRKSLGNKRKALSEDHIRDITRLFGEFSAGENSKIFRNEDFGFWRITVERPKRLRFEVTAERIAAYREALVERAAKTAAKKRKKDAPAYVPDATAITSTLLDALSAMLGTPPVDDRAAFFKLITKQGVALAAADKKDLEAFFAERHEDAPPVKNRKGELEPDPDLRDAENVLLTDDIAAYMEREVLPHVPDAWVDEDKTKKGYEIPFTRHFYKYTPPRPLEEIDEELRELGAEIQELLKEVMA